MKTKRILSAATICVIVLALCASVFAGCTGSSGNEIIVTGSTSVTPLMEKLAEELNAKYYTKESKANLSNKLKRGSLRYIDMQRIADILGYTIDIR